MAIVKEVSFTYGRTHNIGNYESVRFEHSETRTLEPGDKADDVLNDMAAKVVPLVDSTVLALGQRIINARSGVTS